MFKIPHLIKEDKFIITAPTAIICQPSSRKGITLIDA
jgi:hypothetical protein